MAKKKYLFNPDTLSYEETDNTFLHFLKRVLLHLLSATSIAVVFFFLFISFIRSPEEVKLIQEKNRLQAQYKLLERNMDEVNEILEDMQQRDDNLYRVVFQADPIPYSVRKSVTGKSDYYDQLLTMTNSQIAAETTKKYDEIKKQLYIQSKSYDELVGLAGKQEEMLQCIPAIQPILNKDLTRTASGFGGDPIYRTRRFLADLRLKPILKSTAGNNRNHGNKVLKYGEVNRIRYLTVTDICKVTSGRAKEKRGCQFVGNNGNQLHLHYKYITEESYESQNHTFDLRLGIRQNGTIDNNGQMFD